MMSIPAQAKSSIVLLFAIDTPCCLAPFPWRVPYLASAHLKPHFFTASVTAFLVSS